MKKKNLSKLLFSPFKSIIFVVLGHVFFFLKNKQFVLKILINYYDDISYYFQ